MQYQVWQKLIKEFQQLRVCLLPGATIIGLMSIVRLTGFIQPLDWLVFDHFLQHRPPEPIDERIVIVGINENDLHHHPQYPISDHDLASLLQQLQTYQPRAIGLDIYRDLPINPGHDEIEMTFKKFPNIIGIEKVLPDAINPPPTLPPAQIGFADQIIDSDGKLRRSLLATPTPQGYKFSLSLRLAELYLNHFGIKLENGIRDPDTIRFGSVELPRVLPNFGGYVGVDAGGVQVLLNFRSGQSRFRTLSWEQLRERKFSPEWIRDRIVILGMTAASAKDSITTSAMASPTLGRVYGVEIQAHAVSQILSAVLNSRPMLNSWGSVWINLWITAWGFVGIISARFAKSPWVNLLVITIAFFIFICISYLLLILGWWIPVVPSGLVLTFNGIGLAALYQYDLVLKSKIQARQAIIESTFETIHNGPLQTLSKILKYCKKPDLPISKLLPELEQELEQLNQELRGIYELLQQDSINHEQSLYLGNGLIINLQNPLYEIFYQVYSYTLDRDFRCFKTLKIKIRSFEPIDERNLSLEDKRGLCRFLEEALCNVGKHAIGVTSLKVTCGALAGWNKLSILDNGLGVKSSKEGRGTQQFKNLARQIKGKFRRVTLFPHGTLCELSWPVPIFPNFPNFPNFKKIQEHKE
jgi:CHASE2 domain-containing sensor protein